jgi:hypothetical protein
MRRMMRHPREIRLREVVQARRSEQVEEWRHRSSMVRRYDRHVRFASEAAEPIICFLSVFGIDRAIRLGSQHRSRTPSGPSFAGFERIAPDLPGVSPLPRNRAGKRKVSTWGLRWRARGFPSARWAVSVRVEERRPPADFSLRMANTICK